MRFWNPHNPSMKFQFRLRLAYAYLIATRVAVAYLWLRAWKGVLSAESYDRGLSRLHQRNARRVERAIVKLGGLFVKVGQLLSSMTNFMPDEFRAELEGLQDSLPARPTDQVMATLRAELHAPVEEIFVEFDHEPLASASLAQVHAATLRDGRRVAVKVQHADIEMIAHVDLEAIRRILAVVQWFTKARGLENYPVEIGQMIAEELDFTQEARNIETIAANFKGDSMIRLPSVVHEQSTRRVLTTTLMAGTKVSAVEELDARGIDRNALARRIVMAYCRMIFVDAVYHADPHPGNILVADDGGVIFLDFGAVGHLSPPMKEGIPQFFQGVIRRDRDQITKAVQTMGFVARDPGSNNVADRVINYFQRRYFDDMSEESFKLGDFQIDMQDRLEMLADLRRLDVSFRQLTETFQVPKDWVLLERTLLLLLGLCTHLDRALNPMQVLRPYLEEFVFGKERGWLQLMRTSLKETFATSLTLPDGVRSLLTQTNRGELEIRTPDVRIAADVVYAGMRQLVYAMFVTGSTVLAYVAHGRGEIAIYRTSIAAAILFGILLIASAFTRPR
jgi:ubiquinone biosynthesis protein